MNRVQIIALVLAFTVGIMIMLYVWTIKQGKSVNEEKENYCPITEEAITALESAEYVTLEKVERELIEDSDGSFESNYYTYFVSEFMLIGVNPVVDDYSLALAESGFDQNFIRQVSFKDAFGFEYKGENALVLLTHLLEKHGIDGNIENVTFDTETYGRTKQKQYVLNEPCSITKELLGDDYELILEERVHYELATLKSGVEVPDCFLVTVKYTSGGQIVTKTLYLQVGINEWEAGLSEEN